MKCSRSRLTYVCGPAGSVAKLNGYDWLQFTNKPFTYAHVRSLIQNSRASMATLRGGTVTNCNRNDGYTSQGVQP